MARVALLFSVLILGLPHHAAADEMITSDTLAYCNSLAETVQKRDVSSNVRTLLTEGQAMCRRGYVIGGLRRIRLAMMIVRGPLPRTP